MVPVVMASSKREGLYLSAKDVRRVAMSSYVTLSESPDGTEQAVARHRSQIRTVRPCVPRRSAPAYSSSLTAEHDGLQGFSCPDGDGGWWSGKHATEPGGLWWHQADTAFEEAQARRELERPCSRRSRSPARLHKALGLGAPLCPRPFCLLPVP